MAELLFTYGPANIGNLLATTASKRDKKELADAVFNEIPTFEYLNKKGKVSVDGGATILLNLEVAKNDQAGFYSGYDILSTAPVEFATTAQYQWKQAYAPVSISGRESDIQNRGEAALINLLDAKQRNAEKSLRDLINRKLHGSANTVKEVTSLSKLIDATSTVGDINSTSNSYWQSTLKTSGAFATQGIADWRNLKNTLGTKGGKTDLILTTQTVHEAYEATMAPQIRYTDMGTANAKFGDLKFGTAMVRFDEQCASGVAYFLDSDHIFLYVAEGRNFIYNQPVRPPEQDAVVMDYLVALELATDNRRTLGKATGIS
jgi:hypothetical protein